ncbi:L-ascorbate metabolism protein UlaG (beta-lactamase superfamily) [Sporomusaceae bacterium BoRhaA]|uniref:MBL fold metallo-hydrolase n=1 Tax=Pelorhabdus rhamnosifermentans TaxID=2772457 RepID=UPI001C062E00|nr:MBL fold metallo-hydrolase [Pelorhabdus rhamnosifermentans]MBU2701268.1 L-ascorbate metabolism protein UlaG (beta-lactamase superfamily) [Pelorhabdus rhamnosifermentans]
MKIKWLGHSCFLLTADNGVRVLTDPFDSSVGYEVPDVAADIVSTSHKHSDHNYTQAVQGEFFHIDKTGKFFHKGIEIIGVATFHDEEGGAQRGKNTIYKFIVDGLHICHCGDLGHILTPEQRQEIGPVDILLIPVGGFYTIGPDQAVEVAKMLQPSVIIPMHFKTEPIQYPIAGVESFLQKIGGGKRVGKQEVEYDKASMASVSNVVVLDYA